jgi:hypothetical protein
MGGETDQEIAQKLTPPAPTKGGTGGGSIQQPFREEGAANNVVHLPRNVRRKKTKTKPKKR